MIEYIVRDHIVRHMSSNRLFADEQHGFVPCITNLLLPKSVYEPTLLLPMEEWTEAVEFGYEIDIIYTVFDSIPHNRLAEISFGAHISFPVETSIRIFHTYISPILLYNVENWSVLTDKKIQGFNNSSVFMETLTSKVDLVHRKLLKFALGVSKSCPNLAVYGETGETPLSFKGYRLTLNFWQSHQFT